MTPAPIRTAAATLAALLIADEEGRRLDAYYDRRGRCWSQGFGFCTLLDGSAVTQHSPPLTVAECDALLSDKLAAIYMPGVLHAMACPLSDCQFAALSSFTWNEGVGRLAESSIPRLGRGGAWSAVQADMQQYVVAGGVRLPDLVGRRLREGLVLRGVQFVPGKRTGLPLGHGAPLPAASAGPPAAKPLPHPGPTLAEAHAVVSPAQSIASPADVLNGKELDKLG